MSKAPDSNRSREGSSEDVAATSILNVMSRGAVVIVGGILVWGFSKIDRSLEEMHRSINGIQIVISRLEADRDGMKEKLNALDAHVRTSAQAWQSERPRGAP